MSKNVQVVKMSKSILYYFKMVMNFDNESQEYRDATEKEFKEELTKALNCGVANKEIEWLINSYSNDGDTILDNTFGSCTCGIACINTNRNFIGIENDEKHFNISLKRVEEKRKEKDFNVVTSFGYGV